MGWIQKATASIKKRGTEGVCTGDKFGGPTCPPGSKRYNLAKTFKKMSKKQEGGENKMDSMMNKALEKANNSLADQLRRQFEAKAKEHEKKYKEKNKKQCGGGFQCGGAVGPNGIL